MAVKLQIDEELSPIAQSVKDENGKTSPLTLSTNVVGIGTMESKSSLAVAGANNHGDNSAMIELINTDPNGRTFGVGSAREGLFQIGQAYSRETGLCLGHQLGLHTFDHLNGTHFLRILLAWRRIHRSSCTRHSPKRMGS